MTDGRAVDVRFGEGTPHADTIGAVARTLGVDVVAHEGGGVDTVVGDVTLPADAPRWMIEAAVLRALGPKHVLFLCVANSARSQMGEGLARSLAPDDVKISSAGSEPTQVRPQAIQALSEVGLDITGHASNGTDDVEDHVDTVITLCAEEVCPVWLGHAWRLHWGLPDPAGAGETPEEEMDAFRSVRAELTRRLTVLFRGTSE
ncbi:MAG: arsenate reductase ArsC [Longimicrobiales bacterium]|nr:arsenate reductase ArsC [Longimicrobiales bacterium]